MESNSGAPAGEAPCISVRRKPSPRPGPKRADHCRRSLKPLTKASRAREVCNIRQDSKANFPVSNAEGDVAHCEVSFYVTGNKRENKYAMVVLSMDWTTNEKKPFPAMDSLDMEMAGSLVEVLTRVAERYKAGSLYISVEHVPTTLLVGQGFAELDTKYAFAGNYLHLDITKKEKH